jgi:hypothetical protein
MQPSSVLTKAHKQMLPVRTHHYLTCTTYR